MMRKVCKKRRGFTLVELLIVVAIIGILAGIAIPNFLGARTKAKISRSFADMRTMADALELYYSDMNTYPTDISGGIGGTTRYLASVPKDPFNANDSRKKTPDGTAVIEYGYAYFTGPSGTPTMWLIVGNGPDSTPDVTSIADANWTNDKRVSGEVGGENGATSGYGETAWWDGTVLSGKGDIGRGGP